MASGYTYNDGSTCTCGSNRDSGSTQFGACYDATSHAMTCSISDNDCAPGETWLDPQEALLSHGFACPCEAVKTGACHNPSGVRPAKCAVYTVPYSSTL